MFKYSYKHLSKNIQLFKKLIRNANTVQLCFINSWHNSTFECLLYFPACLSFFSLDVHQ